MSIQQGGGPFTRKRFVSFAIAVIGGGALGALLSVALTGEESSLSSSVPIVVATTLQETTTTTEVPWVAPGEARVATTVIIPLAVRADGGTVEFEYDLKTVSPQWPNEDDRSDPPRRSVEPERWRLLTALGSFDAVTNEWDRRVRFDVPADFTRDDVMEIRLVGWRVSLPFSEEVDVELSRGATSEFFDGGSVTVRAVLEQSNGSIVQFATEPPPTGYSAGEPEWFIDIVTPGWVAGEGWYDGYQLLTDSTTVSGSVRLRYSQSMWVPLEGDVLVWQEEV